MDRTLLASRVADARTLINELTRDQNRESDFEGRARFRAPLANAREALDDAQAELAKHDAREQSDERQAERARGRASAAAALDITADTALWATLQAQLAAARATAAKLKARGAEAAQFVVATLCAHSVNEAATRGALVLPQAGGSDSGTVEALAVELKALIEAMPGGFRLTSEWLTPNHYAFTCAVPGRTVPTLVEARKTAADALRGRLSGLCAEPVPVVKTAWDIEVDYAHPNRRAA